MEHLQQDFPYVPKPHIRSWFNRCHFLYAPAYLALAEEAKQPNPPYTRKSNPYRPGKGKTPERFDADFEQERAFILRIRREEQQKRDAELAEELIEKQAEESGEVIECGCCFTSYPFFKMIQCPDAHLFCKECMLSYAETKLGSHDVKISCMDQSGCKELFPESELRRFLPEKLMTLYDRVKQRKEIEQAGLDGLEECPFCDYKVVIDNPDEKLFRCGNVEDCGAVSCRNCKKLDHLPKTCQEMEEDKKLDSQHLVEEAMSKALVRNCPNAQCGKPFIKDDGCNKIVCTNCRTLSCYICRKVIAGYEHFNQAAPGTASTSKKCPLWDGPVERRHAEEVSTDAPVAITVLMLHRSARPPSAHSRSTRRTTSTRAPRTSRSTSRRRRRCSRPSSPPRAGTPRTFLVINFRGWRAWVCRNRAWVSSNRAWACSNRALVSRNQACI
ncbi:hypothetical protein EV714DRAFT_201568 [Schizophyllum commune]